MSLSILKYLRATHKEMEALPIFQVSLSTSLRANPNPLTLRWPLQDIRSLQILLALITYSVLAPRTCIVHTIAIRLRDYRTIYAPPPTLLVYAMHHTILIMAVSC